MIQRLEEGKREEREGEEYGCWEIDMMAVLELSRYGADAASQSPIWMRLAWAIVHDGRQKGSKHGRHGIRRGPFGGPTGSGSHGSANCNGRRTRGLAPR